VCAHDVLNYLSCLQIKVYIGNYRKYSYVVLENVTYYIHCIYNTYHNHFVTEIQLRYLNKLNDLEYIHFVLFCWYNRTLSFFYTVNNINYSTIDIPT